MRTATLVAAVAACLSYGAVAQAADLSSHKDDAEASYVPVNTWTGFYVGLGVGGDFVNHDLRADLNLGRTSAFGELNGFGGNGVFGTAQVGYDWQLSRYVIGVFADYDFASSAESKASIGVSNGRNSASASLSFGLDDKWTVGGRAGYLVNANTLLYALGGYTEASFKLPSGLSNGTFSGYSVGGGLETALGKNWYLKGEYRFTQLDKQNIFAVSGRGASFTISDEPTIQSARLVLTYKFNEPATYSPMK